MSDKLLLLAQDENLSEKVKQLCKMIELIDKAQKLREAQRKFWIREGHITVHQRVKMKREMFNQEEEFDRFVDELKNQINGQA